MFVIWRGWGILTILIVAATSVVVSGVLTTVASSLKLPGWFGLLSISLGLFAAAVANWFIGKRFNSDPGRELVDPQTNQRVVLRTTHTLFFIKMEYWSVPVALVAFAVLLAIFRT